MRVLIVGSGGREHALAYALSRSPRLGRLFAAPGNAGIETLAECVDVAATDVDGLTRLATRERIDLTVVGPEAPLVLGIADAFARAGLRVFGPTAAAARLEGSKSFAKELCRRHRIPTGGYKICATLAAVETVLETTEHWPVVVKADGLAAGKGVVIARDAREAREAARRMLEAREFGDAGAKVVVEEFLQGTEASVLALVDGRTLALLEPARDHKAAFDGDRGPNTGGMGAVSPARAVTPALLRDVERQILIPTVHALAREGKPFRGFLYAGLMLTKGGPKVLEFNVRLGDPETQAILPRLRSDLLELLDLAAGGQLDRAAPLDWDPRPCCCVVLASGGYPGPYDKGFPIEGLDEAAEDEHVQVFHAGTARQGGRVVTAGGRVLGVTALGDDLRDACARAYRGVSRIRFQDAFYRSDIGRAELEGG